MPKISAVTLKLKNYNSRFPFAKTVGIIKYGRRAKPCAQ